MINSLPAGSFERLQTFAGLKGQHQISGWLIKLAKDILHPKVAYIFLWLRATNNQLSYNKILSEGFLQLES